MIDTVLLKVASRCNLNCTYCYVYHLGDDGWKNNPVRMSRETINAIALSFKQLYQFQQKSFAIVIHGGEPFLLRYKDLEYLFQSLRQSLPDYTTISIQTNGILLNEKLIDLCHQYHVTISISLDGPEKINDALRIDHKNQGSFNRIIHAIELIKNHPKGKEIFTGCLAVIDPFSNPVEIYHFFKQLDIPSVNFLPRDGNHDRYPFGKRNFESTEYGSWLADLWKQYFNDPSPIPIAVFDNIVKLLLGGNSSKEGSGTDLSGILIIDTNGNITKNDTLKSTKNGNDLFQNTWNIQTDNIIELIQTEEFHEYMKLQTPTSEQCQKCSYLEVCGGGMPLYRWSEQNQFNNPSVFCKDHQTLIKAVQDTLHEYNHAI